MMSMWTKIAEIFSISCQPKTLSHKIECESNTQMFRNGMRIRQFGAETFYVGEDSGCVSLGAMDAMGACDPQILKTI